MPQDPKPVLPSNSLARFLRQEAEAILQEWEARARDATDQARHLPRQELRDSLPDILESMARNAEEARGIRPIDELSAEGARTHAGHRWDWGYTLEGVTREYSMLRTIIMKRMSPQIADMTTEELLFLFESLDGAVNSSISTFVALSQQTLENEQERLAVTLANVGDGVISSDTDGRIRYLNPAAKTILNLSGDAAVGQPVDIVLKTFDEANGYRVESMTNRTLQTRHHETHRADILLGLRDGRRIPAEEIAVPLTDVEGRYFGVVTTIRDVSNIRALTDQLGYLATHDSLTGLPNRSLLTDRLTHELGHGERHGEQVGIIYLDLDLFKEVNDMLGHAAGDDLLRQVAERLRDCVRRTDTVCRVGGDEFIILLTEVSGPDLLGELGTNIATSLRKPFELDGSTVQVSASVGISVFPEDGEDPETLIKHADTAMYQAKALGRNNVQFFAREMNCRAREQRELQGELRHAIPENQLSLHFQPQVELETGRVLGAEVLLRWQHPTLGRVCPGRFIPVAEQSRDIMVSIGDWVLVEACRQARAWLDAGYPPVRMSVNVSVMQLRCERLVEHVRQTLKRFRLPASQLQLELTESVLMSDVAGAVDRVRALEKMGVHIAVDDFGTGYSSLSYLKDLPVDELKIDQSFVHDLATDKGKAAIVDAVIRMGQSLNLRVIAEGVEDSRAVAFLSEHGCEVAQGYYFSRPVTAGVFEGHYLH